MVEKESKLCGASSYRDTSPIIPGTHLHELPKAPSPIYESGGVWAMDIHSVHNTR